ncbi:MAG: hypothetical protein ABS56_05990 [Lautropia sp. SCN 69-89]|nr:MAG: hypothetical protein ABS56_05990 [Lautropia sp. SCN 69-89]
MVVNLADQSTRFFNRSAAYIIEQFFAPAAEDSLDFPDRVHAHALVEMLQNKGILVPALADNGISADAAFHLDTMEFQPGIFHTPLGLEIELTRRCSRRCSYCSYDSSPTVNTEGELDESAWKSILDNAAGAGVVFVRFTGGDPMLRHDFWSIVRHADTLGLLITIGSDLSKFAPVDCERLKSLRNLYCIHTTLDGPNREIADRLRGNGNFTKVISALPLLREARIPFLVSMVITSLNYSLVGETARLARTLGARYFVASPLYAAGRGREVNALAPNKEQLLSVARQLRDVSFGGDEELACFELPSADVDQGASLARDADWLLLQDGMRAADRFMRVDPFGNCYTSIKAVEALGDGALAGNATLLSIESIWRNSKLLNTIRSIPSSETQFGKIVSIKELVGTSSTKEDA